MDQGGLLIDVPGSPVVAYSINFSSGSDKKTRAYPFQVAHVLEHVIETGPDTPNYPKKSTYLHEVSMNGALRNAFTGEFGINYIGDCIPDELVRILKLRLSAIENPKFRKDIVDSEIGNVMEEMKQRVADYTRLANALSRKSLSAGNWQTSKEAMTEASNVTLEDVVNYYRATHTSSNLNFTVAGNLSRLSNSITELFDTVHLPKGERLSGPTLVPSTINTYSYEERPSLENLFTSFAMAIPRKLNAKEIATMQVINHVLCNSWDSMLLGVARERGLCYSMRGYTEMTKTQSIWSLDTPISQKNAEPFFNLMSTSLNQLARDSLADSDLEKAKAFLIGRFKKKGQTSQELVWMYAEDFFARDIITSTEERIELLESITSKDISTLVKEFLLSRSRVFSGVGSIKEVEFNIHYARIDKSLPV